MTDRGESSSRFDPRQFLEQLESGRPPIPTMEQRRAVELGNLEPIVGSRRCVSPASRQPIATRTLQVRRTTSFSRRNPRTVSLRSGQLRRRHGMA